MGRLLYTLICLILIAQAASFSLAAEPYNLEIEIPHEYQEVAPGEKIWFTSKVLNLANQGRVDIILEYSLFDERGILVSSRSETVAIETQASFVGSIGIPSEAPSGEYDLQVKVTSASGSTSRGNTSITVLEKQSFFKTYQVLLGWILTCLALFLFLVWFIPFLRRCNRNRSIKRRVSEIVHEKIRRGSISSEDLQNSKLPNRPNSKSEEDKEKVF